MNGTTRHKLVGFTAALLLAPLTAFSAAVAADLVTVYPEAPLPRAIEFTVQANGHNIPVYNAGTFRCCAFRFLRHGAGDRYLSAWPATLLSKSIHFPKV